MNSADPMASADACPAREDVSVELGSEQGIAEISLRRTQTREAAGTSERGVIPQLLPAECR